MELYSSSNLIKLVQVILIQALTLSDESMSTLNLLDVGCGVGLQTQALSNMLEAMGIRQKVRIIGIGPLSEELTISFLRKTYLDNAVYDVLINSTAAGLGAKLNGIQIDLMMSTGVMGSYVFQDEFRLMLSLDIFTNLTRFMFAARARCKDNFINILHERNLVGTTPIYSYNKGGYDRTLRTSDGTVLNREYAFILVNSKLVQHNKIDEIT